jgi:penicillin-binding protein 2
VSFHPNDVARRARIVRGVLALVMAAFGLAFFRVQVLRSSLYAMQADGNRMREVPLVAPRGIIYDRHGEILAENLPGYTVSLLSPTADSLRSALKALGQIVPIDESHRALVMRRYERARNQPAVIFNDAPFDVVSALEEHRIQFPELIIQSSPRRYYPDGEAVASVMGYIGEISDLELTLPRFEGYKAGNVIGKAGLERRYEAQLRGTEGRRFVEVDARGRVVREDGVRPAIAPAAPPALTSTLDLELQRFIHERYKDSLLGAIVAIDPQTGGVLALYSGPTFDINRFTGSVPPSYFAQLNEDPRRPLYNKATQGRYPPASTWKLATAAIAMEQGIAEIDTHMEVPCAGGYQFGNRYFRCWKRDGGHGHVNMAQAIATSCDVYFYQLGLKIGLSNLVASGLRMGFGTRTGIDYPEETTPQFPPEDFTAYYNNEYGARGWSRSVILNLSIGQGENAQTVINMARFYTALATDGTAATPHLVERDSIGRDTLFRIRPDQLQALRDAMADVVSGRGTAGSAAIQGLAIAGKTGTAQVTGKPDHAWFVGFAPHDKPKIVVAVFLEFGLHGYSAARIATKVMEQYLKTSLVNASATADNQ